MFPAAKMAIPAADSAGPSARLDQAAAGAIASALALETATVTVRNPAEALASLESEWTALAEDATEPNCFAEHWFVAASVDALGVDEDVRLLEVRRGGRLIGIFMAAIGTDYGRTPVRHVANWWHHNLFLGIPLVRRGEALAFWSALLDALDQADWAPNFIHLRDISEDGPVHRGLVAAAAARGRSCATVHREVRALLASDLEPQAYYERQVRPKKRKEIRRLRNRLGELGPVQARTLGDGDDLVGWCDAFLALERAGWKGEAGSALACDAGKQAFFRAAVAGAHARGRLHFLRLDLGDRPIAMLVNFLAAPGSFSFKTAFDEDYARFSPGVLVQLENLAVLERADIGWMDSCAAENHPMIDSLWSGRRGIVRVTVRLSGPRRRLVYVFCRTLEIGSRVARRLAGKELP